MHHLILIAAAVGLAASNVVWAAPRGMSSDASDAGSHSNTDGGHTIPEVLGRGMQFARSAQAPAPTDCPAPVVVVTTTTIDVTIYVTPEPTSTEPCDEEPPMTTHIATHVYNMTVPEPCDDDTTTMPHWQKVNITMPETPSTVPMSTSQWNSTATTTKTPGRTTTTTEPCDDTTATPTPTPCDEGMTWSSSHNSTTTMTMTSSIQTTRKPQTTDCVIDTSMVPVSTSTLTATATMTIHPTKTQCVHDEPTGKPVSDSMYCGIHGKPAGTYFIAEFIENKPGESVTEEGCYQFCDSVMESTKGCQSYRFSKNQLGATRCSLYGRGVALSVADLDKNQPDVWYDLTCGSPTAEKWHQNMPANHGRRAIAASKQ